MDYYNYFRELLARLVAIPSVSQNERECAEFLKELLCTELGMEAELHEVEGNGCNVYASFVRKGNDSVCKSLTPASKKGRCLLLGGHIDTVSAGEGWNTDPFVLTTNGDKAFGRGALDMKGGLAAQIAVLKRLYDEGFAFDGSIEFAALCDEERYSVGADAYVKRKMSKTGDGETADFCILGEPHFDNIVVGATGKVLLELIVEGSAGHAAVPESGVNAVDCMAGFIKAINDKYGVLYREGQAASHCVLKIESRYEGYSLSIPDECRALLNKQLYISESADDLVSDLYDLYEEKIGNGTLKIERRIPYYPSYSLDQSNGDLQALLTLLREKHGTEPELRLNQSVSDGNILYRQLGIPTVLFGPDGGELHKANEYISLSSAYKYMDMLYDYIKTYFRAGEFDRL